MNSSHYFYQNDVVDVVYWPQTRTVLPNYEVVYFQPQPLNTMRLVSVAYFYEDIIPVPHIRPSRR